MTSAGSHTRRNALGMLGGSLACPAFAFSPSDLKLVSGSAFGSGWQIIGAQAERPSGLRPEFETLFADIDLTLSPWRHDSDISRFNRASAGHFAEQPSLVAVTRAARLLAEQSEGAFDPTVGPFVALWGFGPVEGAAAPGWREISVGPGGVRKTHPDLTLDLCGIAKGWALDQAARRARTAGYRNLLLELGGEFVAIGHHPSGREWQVAVEPPLPGSPVPARLRVMDGWAIATSGTGSQSYILNGQRYSHLIDPKTRAPVAGALRSVTVAAENTMHADGWATALFASGDVAGPELAAARNISALFVFEESGDMRSLMTGAMPELLL